MAALQPGQNPQESIPSRLSEYSRESLSQLSPEEIIDLMRKHGDFATIESPAETRTGVDITIPSDFGSVFRRTEITSQEPDYFRPFLELDVTAYRNLCLLVRENITTEEVIAVITALASRGNFPSSLTKVPYPEVRNPYLYRFLDSFHIFLEPGSDLNRAIPRILLALDSSNNLDLTAIRAIAEYNCIPIEFINETGFDSLMEWGHKSDKVALLSKDMPLESCDTLKDGDHWVYLHEQHFPGIFISSASSGPEGITYSLEVPFSLFYRDRDMRKKYGDRYGLYQPPYLILRQLGTRRWAHPDLDQARFSENILTHVLRMLTLLETISPNFDMLPKVYEPGPYDDPILVRLWITREILRPLPIDWDLATELIVAHDLGEIGPLSDIVANEDEKVRDRLKSLANQLEPQIIEMLIRNRHIPYIDPRLVCALFSSTLSQGDLTTAEKVTISLVKFIDTLIGAMFLEAQTAWEQNMFNPSCTINMDQQIPLLVRKMFMEIGKTSPLYRCLGSTHSRCINVTLLPEFVDVLLKIKPERIIELAEEAGIYFHSVKEVDIRIDRLGKSILEFFHIASEQGVKVGVLYELLFYVNLMISRSNSMHSSGINSVPLHWMFMAHILQTIQRDFSFKF